MPNDTAVFDASANASHLQIGYCTNVHAGADLLATRANLEKYALAVKNQVSPDRPMGVGLWLSAEAANDLLQHQLIETFAEWLNDVGLVPFTLNGFPYGDFHADVVKHGSIRPDWTDIPPRRYTESLIEIQDRLLAPRVEGSISTLPLAWGAPPPADEQWSSFADHFRQSLAAGTTGTRAWTADIRLPGARARLCASAQRRCGPILRRTTCWQTATSSRCGVTCESATTSVTARSCSRTSSTYWSVTGRGNPGRQGANILGDRPATGGDRREGASGCHRAVARFHRQTVTCTRP
jgi:hypothetical protein